MRRECDRIFFVIYNGQLVTEEVFSVAEILIQLDWTIEPVYERIHGPSCLRRQVPYPIHADVVCKDPYRHTANSLSVECVRWSQVD